MTEPLIDHRFAECQAGETIFFAVPDGKSVDFLSGRGGKIHFEQLSYIQCFIKGAEISSSPDGGIGRRNRLKICRPQGLRVQVPFRVPFSSQLTGPGKTALSTLKIHDFLSKCLVCLFFFCRAKNGTVHYGGGLPSLRSGSAALRAWSSPVLGTIFPNI